MQLFHDKEIAMSKSLLRLKTQHNYQNEPFSPCKKLYSQLTCRNKNVKYLVINKKSSFYNMF